MKQIKVTEITVSPEIAAALCPDGEPSAECWAHGEISCKNCPLDVPKDGDLILLRVKSTKSEKQKEIMIGS